MHVQAPPAPKGENPRDTALLRKLRRARERGASSEERALIGELLAGWLGPVEEQQRFWGLSPADAQEVAGAWMERMTKVLMKKTNFNGPFGAVALLNAQFERRDFIRRRERRPAESLKEDPNGLRDRSDVDGDHLEVENWPSEPLERALASLTDRERKMLYGFFAQDRPGADVAAELGMSPEAFRVAQHRAIGKLRRWFEAEGVTRPDL
jgi:RNA polymerase sigma factor (sigma-70 family)